MSMRACRRVPWSRRLAARSCARGSRARRSALPRACRGSHRRAARSVLRAGVGPALGCADRRPFSAWSGCRRAEGGFDRVRRAPGPRTRPETRVVFEGKTPSDIRLLDNVRAYCRPHAGPCDVLGAPGPHAGSCDVLRTLGPHAGPCDVLRTLGPHARPCDVLRAPRRGLVATDTCPKGHVVTHPRVTIRSIRCTRALLMEMMPVCTFSTRILRRPRLRRPRLRPRLCWPPR